MLIWFVNRIKLLTRFRILKRPLQCSYQTQYQTMKWVLKLSIPSSMISGSNSENLKHTKLQPNPIYPYAYKKSTSSMLHCIINAALHYHRCFAPVALLCIVNTLSHCQCYIKKWSRYSRWTLSRNPKFYTRILSNN